MRQRKRIVATAALLAIALSTPALAHGVPRGGRDGFAGPGPGHGGAGPVLGQLIFPCRTACLDTVRTCSDAADSEAVTCISGACSAEVTAAQSACADNARSDACRAAVSDLRDCGDACLDTRAAAIDTCRDALSDCRAACESTEE